MTGAAVTTGWISTTSGMRTCDAAQRSRRHPVERSEAMEPDMRAVANHVRGEDPKAPTLIMQNVGDYRVTTTQSYKLYPRAEGQRRAAKFIAYPISGHNADDPVRQRDVQRRWIEWLEEHFNEVTTSSR